MTVLFLTTVKILIWKFFINRMYICHVSEKGNIIIVDTIYDVIKEQISGELGEKQ